MNDDVVYIKDTDGKFHIHFDGESYDVLTSDQINERGGSLI